MSGPESRAVLPPPVPTPPRGTTVRVGRAAVGVTATVEVAAVEVAAVGVAAMGVAAVGVTARVDAAVVAEAAVAGGVAVVVTGVRETRLSVAGVGWTSAGAAGARLVAGADVAPDAEAVEEADDSSCRVDQVVATEVDDAPEDAPAPGGLVVEQAVSSPAAARRSRPATGAATVRRRPGRGSNDEAGSGTMAPSSVSRSPRGVTPDSIRYATHRATGPDLPLSPR